VALAEAVVIFFMAQQRQSMIETFSIKEATPSSVDCQSNQKPEPVLEGVAVTLWTGSPRWFQNRYSMMLALVHAYLPPNWKIQIFHHPTKEMALQALAYPGVQRLLQKGAVILTPLPEELAKKKRKDILVSEWLWQHVAAERVLTFGGTSTLCGNSPRSLSDPALSSLDYVGGPWGSFDGVGGEAGLTLRNRTFMLATAAGLARETGWTRRDSGREESEIVGLWNDVRLNNGSIPFSLASREDTLTFAMNDLNDVKQKPLGAIGTLGGLSDEARKEALEYCPELKLFYPSLAGPPCFGAAPNAAACFKFLCDSGGLRCDAGPPVRAKGRPQGGKGGKGDVLITITAA
jgi:hypothetical protein